MAEHTKPTDQKTQHQPGADRREGQSQASTNPGQTTPDQKHRQRDEKGRPQDKHDQKQGQQPGQRAEGRPGDRPDSRPDNHEDQPRR